MKSFVRVLSFSVLSAVCIAEPSHVSIQSAVDSGTISLKEALQKSLQGSPQLALFPYEQRAAEARRLQAGLRPNPELSVELENVAGNGEYSGADAAEYTLVLSQLVELGDKRGKRQALADLDSETNAGTYAVTRLDVLAETTRRYIEAVRAQALHDWASQSAASTEKALRVTRQRVQAGAAPAVEADRMHLATARAQRLVDRSRRDVTASYHRLAASWGDDRPGFRQVQQNLYRLPVLPDLAAMQDKLWQSPRMMQFLTQQRLREAQLRLAESAATPDLRVGMGVRHLEEAGDNALVFSFAMPLAINDRNQGNIAEARASLEKNSAEQALVQNDLLVLLQTLYLQAESSREEALQLHGKDVPLAEKTLRDITAGYAGGRYSQLELINAQQELQALQREAIEAATGFHLIVLELERLTGESVSLNTAPASDTGAES